ncbi:PucR family transcriptional regulator [Nocardia sp. NPDC057668]|uniref:PucR family transcriptional regulator n=1 Tax=Nocardia sp. NPDC057668 TaxID=3346202 RepID=UPI00366D8434
MVAVRPELDLDSALFQRFTALLPTVAEELFGASLATMPEVAELPDDHFTPHVLPAIVATMTGFLHSLQEQRPFSVAEISDHMTPVIQRHVEERIPVRALIDAFFGGARRLWTMALELAEPEDLPDLVAFSLTLFDLLNNLTLAMADDYLAVEQSFTGIERDARRALCAALLRGADVGELAVSADLTPAAEYDVLAIRVRSAAHAEPLAGHAMARRRLRLVQNALDDLVGTSALHTFDGSSGIALLPVRSDGVRARYLRLATMLTQQLGTAVLLVPWPRVATAELPEPARQAAELAELAAMLERPGGVYELDDLLLEFQLTRPGPARDRLADRIAPLLDHPHLLESLDAHIRFGADRKAAAAEVHVHPNTFSYRLRRVAELTGIDPADPGGSRLIAAALIIHRLYPAESPARVDNTPVERLVSGD